MAKLINEILLEIRKSHKLSRKGLENLSAFKERTIASYERGEREPSKEYIRFMSLYFNLRVEDNAKYFYNEFEKVILMYQDIYNYDERKMIQIFNEENINYFKIFKRQSYKNFRDIAQILKICEKLKLKPSSFGLTTKHIDVKNISFFTDENRQEIEEKIKKMEEIGLFLDKSYYASIIKRRNQQIKTYTPNQEIKELPKKYQAIVDLLPYASDKFLEDIYKKLKTMKEIQTI